MRHFIFRRTSITKKQLVVHVAFAVQSALKHSVFRRLLRPKFRANFLKKSIFVPGRYARGEEGLEITSI